MTKQLAGILMAVLGGLLLIVSLATVNLFSFSSRTRWDFETTIPVSMTLIAALAIGLALASVSFRSIWLPVAAACCSLYLLGGSAPFLDSYSGAGTGYWLNVAATGMMAIGSLLLTADRIRSQNTA